MKRSIKKGSKRSKSGLVQISNVLESSAKKTQAAFTISKLLKDWPIMVGDLLVSQTRPKKMDRNILWISVENSGLHYELSLMKPMLIEKIAEVTGMRFKDLKFVHEAVHMAPQANEPSSRKKFERVQADPAEDLARMIQRIKILSLDLQKKVTKNQG